MIDPKGRVTLEASDTQNITAEKYVSVTSSNKISHINNVQLDASPLTAFVDYYYDIKNRKIVFFEEQTGELTFDIYTGINWIQPGITRKEDLKTDSFPWISVIYVGRPTTTLGNFDACKITNNRIQVDVWIKKDYFKSIDIGGYTSNLGDDKLAMYLGRQVKKSLDDNAFDLTSKHFRDYIPIENVKLKTFNTELNNYNSWYEFFIKSVEE